jgi:hypothetical protein
MWTRRERLRSWLREGRLPKESREAERAARRAEMATDHQTREQRAAGRAVGDAEARHSIGLERARHEGP